MRHAARQLPAWLTFDVRQGKPMNLEFRECVATDRDWAYALKSEAYRDVVERQFGPWNEEFQCALFATRWNPATSRIIVIDGSAVGLIALEDRGEELWLDEIQIVREWRGRGIGSSIIRDLLSRAIAAHKPLRLQVLKSNDSAKKLYLRLGLDVVAESETHYRMESKKTPNQSLEPTPTAVTPRADGKKLE